MAIDPAAISANPASTTTWEEFTAPESPAASAKGTVRPSDMPITTSRTSAVDPKCPSTWAGGAGGAGVGRESVGIRAVYLSGQTTTDKRLPASLGMTLPSNGAMARVVRPMHETCGKTHDFGFRSGHGSRSSEPRPGRQWLWSTGWWRRHGPGFWQGKWSSGNGHRCRCRQLHHPHGRGRHLQGSVQPQYAPDEGPAAY